jgi:hypothetical protein
MDDWRGGRGSEGGRNPQIFHAPFSFRLMLAAYSLLFLANLGRGDILTKWIVLGSIVFSEEVIERKQTFFTFGAVCSLVLYMVPTAHIPRESALYECADV